MTARKRKRDPFSLWKAHDKTYRGSVLHRIEATANEHEIQSRAYHATFRDAAASYRKSARAHRLAARVLRAVARGGGR